jgi:hypothetical protein
VDERLRAERLEAGERLGQQHQRLVEPARTRGDPAQVRRGKRDAHRVARRAPGPLGLDEELFGLREPLSG